MLCRQPSKSRAEMVKNARLMRLLSPEVYAFGRKVRRHRSQYILWRSWLRVGSTSCAGGRSVGGVVDAMAEVANREGVQ